MLLLASANQRDVQSSPRYKFLISSVLLLLVVIVAAVVVVVGGGTAARCWICSFSFRCLFLTRVMWYCVEGGSFRAKRFEKNMRLIHRSWIHIQLARDRKKIRCMLFFNTNRYQNCLHPVFLPYTPLKTKPRNNGQVPTLLAVIHCPCVDTTGSNFLFDVWRKSRFVQMSQLYHCVFALTCVCVCVSARETMRGHECQQNTNVNNREKGVSIKLFSSHPILYPV